MAAAVLLPASLGALHAEGLLLAEADGAEAVGGNAKRDEILLDGARAAVAQTQVVFRGAALVAMTFHGHLEPRICFQEGCRLGGWCASGRGNIGLVVVGRGGPHFFQAE